MKKAQLMAQPFYYIFVIIVIALIFLFGFNIINKLQETQERTKFTEFKIDFSSKVEYIYALNAGSRLTYTLILPKDVKKVCFTYDLSNLKTKVELDSKYGNDFYVDKLIINNNYCIQAKNNKLDFALENKILDGKTIVQLL